MKFTDLTGLRFGNLTVIKRVNNYITPNGSKHSRWLCLCDCGKYKEIVGSKLKTGNTKSCGCLKTERLKKFNTKHKSSNLKIYRVWRAMKERCYNPKNKRYKNYGERGIKVCDEWLDKENGSSNFISWALENGYKKGLSIDRINVNGNYEPLNCRWITMKEQGRNTTKNRIITYKGESKCLTEWSEITGINISTLSWRLHKGWNVERILSK